MIIDCQPVLMGIAHFKEGTGQGQLFEAERVVVNHWGVQSGNRFRMNCRPCAYGPLLVIRA
jgi:hypothetical protein